jgi:rhamnulose-1-phosphate aldolase
VREIDHWLREIGDAAERLNAIDAIEGAAGNISVFLPAATPGLSAFLSDTMPRSGEYPIPDGGQLPPGALLITGTGRRLREAATRPNEVLCAVVIDTGGSHWLHRHPTHGVMPTSEIDSHAGIHASLYDATEGDSTEARAVIHAQPPHLTYLSHIPAYRDTHRLNRQLYRWQPETLVMLPEGIQMLPFETPGTPAQGTGTAGAMRRYRLVVWAKHGVVAQSARGPRAAADLIDYAEAAARYEVLDLHAGRQADGLTLQELRAIASRFHIHTDLLQTVPEELLA